MPANKSTLYQAGRPVSRAHAQSQVIHRPMQAWLECSHRIDSNRPSFRRAAVVLPALPVYYIHSTYLYSARLRRSVDRSQGRARPSSLASHDLTTHADESCSAQPLAAARVNGRTGITSPATLLLARARSNIHKLSKVPTSLSISQSHWQVCMAEQK